LEDTFVSQSVQDFKENFLMFGRNQLRQFQPQDDYKELLKLTIIFLCENPQNCIFFKVPASVHHARWIAKDLYTLKVFLFRNEFKLTLNEHNAFRDLCIFIVRIYVK
jgi:hypothetical protein